MSVNVLIVQPDAALAERMGQLIVEGTPDATVAYAHRPEDGVTALNQFNDLDLCITELYYVNGDGLAFLSAVRAKFRRARVLIVTSYNLHYFGDYIQGLTVLPTPLDEPLFKATCQDTLATLEGHEFPPFRLGKKQPPDRWGDCYAAYDTGVKRDVFITVIHSWASPEEALQFHNSAAMMARAGHPNVQAVYQAGKYQERDFFAREKWDMPNLSEMATAGQMIDPRLAAQIIHVVGGVMLFWDSNQYPHTTIGATDVSVSPQGIIKVANCVDPTQPVTPPGFSDLSALAQAIHALLPPSEQVPLRVMSLIERLRAGPVQLAQVVGEAQSIDIDLAPEREIELSEEHHIAQETIQVARRKQALNYKIMVGVFGLLVLVVCGIIYSRLDPPSREFKEMVKIPSGPYVYQGAPAMLDHAFYIDKYEVTFGQYLKFLRAVDSAGTDAAWRHPLQKGEKDHQPKDWADRDENGKRIAGIFRCIRDHELYNKELLTLDHPVFNIDWYDAEAYAKWVGKRLPEEHEWEKAARGQQGYFYPWGNTFAPKANVAVTSPDSTVRRGHFHMTVDATPTDKSPYGVYDMAGNVSEWTDTLVASSIIESEQVAVIRGANFQTNSEEHAMLTFRHADKAPATRDYWIGFRCASDNPPVDK